jgi:CubicO group peptidase (beta-lactamase class C family)
MARSRLALGLIFAMTGPAWAQAPDDRSREITYPIGSAADYWRPGSLVGSHSAMDRLFPARRVAAAPAPSALRRGPETDPGISFFHASRSWTLDSYLEGSASTALLVLRRDGTVLVERYLHQRRPDDRFTSWSMAKTVVAMLVGLAVADGRIRSLDDLAAAYVPALANTAYAPVTIRHLLTMSSGVAFDETYDRPNTDIARLAQAALQGRSRGGIATVEWIQQRTAEPGTRWYYASADTQVLGLVLRSAIGQPLAEALEKRIWQPMGAEAGASWLLDASGHEAAYCCLNATLRDYGRLGLLLLNEGRSLAGRQVLPAAWVREMMTPAAAPGAPGGGYGYQMWLGRDGSAAFRGVRGQWISVDRQAGLVVVRLAAGTRSRDPDDNALTGAMLRAVSARFAGGR